MIEIKRAKPKSRKEREADCHGKIIQLNAVNEEAKAPAQGQVSKYANLKSGIAEKLKKSNSVLKQDLE
jgi:hypothetical protein